jgi:pilus assembly protein Flp/PilA
MPGAKHGGPLPAERFLNQKRAQCRQDASRRRASNREQIMTRLYRCTLAVLAGDRSGVTALEYGLIAGLIAVVIIATVKTLGTGLNATFNTIATHFTNGTVN